MKETITFERFCDGFRNGRESHFSYEGKRALFDYLESYEEDTGEEIEFDPIALCCEYTEYDSAYSAMEDYSQPDGMPVEGDEGDGLLEIQGKNELGARKWLEDRTAVIDVGGLTGYTKIIIQNF